MGNEIGLVYESSSFGISVKLESSSYESNKSSLKIGKHLKIDIGNHDFLIAVIVNIKTVSDGDKDKYLIITNPLGTVENNIFIPGSSILPSPTEKVYIPNDETLKHIFLENEKYSFYLGDLVQNRSIKLFLDGNTFFSKHIGIVGSTGSGKSCTVAKILQEAVGITEGINQNKGTQKNAHIIIFDIQSK